MITNEPRLIDDDVPLPLRKYQGVVLPTVHNCIQYRSRTEARWAVFFDSLGLEFEYEAQGYNLGDGINYLPDFWIPAISAWVEIKGETPDDVECEKALRLACVTAKPVYVFFAGIRDPLKPPTAYAFFPDLLTDHGYQWCECPDCGAIGIAYAGFSDRMPCKADRPSALRAEGLNIEVPAPKPGCPFHSRTKDKHPHAVSPRLVDAYQAARSMRFGR